MSSKSLKSSKTSKTSKKEVLTEAREKQWYIPPSGGIPTYKAENDRNCPVGRIGNYNRRQKQRIEAIPDTHKTAQWIKQKLDRKYEDIPLKVHVNLSKKALDEAKGNYDTSVTRPSPAEVEILQKVIVRERLLGELTRLVRSGSDMLSVMGEVVELIKAIRFETVDIVEDISNWQAFQPTPRPFLYKGMNYLIKISCDFDFLDNYDEVVEKFCFEFKSNPFAYKGGGNVITGAGPKNSDRYLQGLLNSYYEGGHINIDGVEVARLHNAEKIIQGEFNRLAEQGNINLGVSQAKIPDALQLMNSSVVIENGRESTTGENALHQSSSSPAFFGQSQATQGGRSSHRPSSSSGGRKAGNAVFNQKKIKLERISTLQGEVDELMAVMSHITEKIKTLTTDYQDRIKMYRAIESKMIDARNAGKEAAAQHCTADLIVRKAALVELTNKVKELQREHYFVGLEKKRKQGVIRTMQTELDEEKRKVALKKKIEEVIKTKGLAAALDLINLQKEEQQQFASKALVSTGSGKTVGGTTGATAASGSGKSLSSKSSKKKKRRKVKGAKRGKGSADDEDGDGFDGEGDEGDDDDEDGRGDDPFGDYSTGTMNFGETFSSQQMQQVQGLNVERIDEGDEDEDDDEGEEEEDGEDGDEDDDEDEDDEGEGEGEDEGEDEEEEGDEEGGPSYFQPPGIDGADAFMAEGAPSPVVSSRREGPVSSAVTQAPAPAPAPASSSSSSSQGVAKKATKGPMTADERLSKQHEEELAYMRQLQAELTDPSATQPTAGHSEDVPNSARSSRSKQLSGQKVGYISDEEEGDDDDEDDLEVSADASTAPAGSGFQLAKALKMSPRLS